MNTRKPKTAKTKKAEKAFSFEAELWKSFYAGGWLYAVWVPEEVSAAIGKRGPVPIFATVNGAVQVQSSLVPMGGGKQRLGLNAKVRGQLGIEPGHKVHFRVRVPEKVPKPKIPAELRGILREYDLLKTFEGFPTGKQRHILEWVGKAAHENTREKRIVKTIEFTQQAKDRAERRAAQKRAPR